MAARSSRTAFGESDEYRATDDRVTDVELLDLWDRGDGADVLHRESVAGVHRQSNRRPVAAPRHAARASVAGSAGACAYCARVQLDRRGAELARRVDRRRGPGAMNRLVRIPAAFSRASPSARSRPDRARRRGLPRS